MAEPIISNTRTLKKRILDDISDDISFYPKDKYLIVHISNLSPYECVLAILKTKGLKDHDIIKSFADTESETDSDSDSDVVFYSLNVQIFLKNHN